MEIYQSIEKKMEIFFERRKMTKKDALGLDSRDCHRYVAYRVHIN